MCPVGTDLEMVPKRLLQALSQRQPIGYQLTYDAGRSTVAWYPEKKVA